MRKIELVPDLSHCIETVTKKEYKKTLRKLLESEEGSDELRERVELLTALLEKIDFKKLRTESEKCLEERRKVKFIFYLENGDPKYDMLVT